MQARQGLDISELAPVISESSIEVDGFSEPHPPWGLATKDDHLLTQNYVFRLERRP
jgi:hypothetical protein